MPGPSTSSMLFWRRTDVEGIERLTPTTGLEGVTADASMICLDDGGFRLDHHWQLDARWRVRYVDLGLSAGFEADLVVDDDGLVLRYEHLFERIG